jgi:cell division protein FtsW (lipid II flippase)/cell division protein FtsI/penicillin-binding protein 2
VAVTRSTAAERRAGGAGGDRLQGRLPGRIPGQAPRRTREALLLGAAGAVVLLGWFLVYRAVAANWADLDKRIAAGEVANLNGLERPEQIAALLTGFPSAAERAFAAAKIWQLAHRAPIPNVGELGRLRVPAAEVRGDGRLTTLRDRVAEKRRTAGAGADLAGLTVPLLSTEQLRDLKSRFIVRTPGQFRGTFLLWPALALLGFAAVHAVWRWRGFTGDPLLLPLALLLCGLGLALMVSVRDPLRDLLVFRTFAQGMIGGCLLLAGASLVDVERSRLRGMSFAPLGGALLLSTLLILFGSGPAGSDAKVNLAGFQPVEVIKILVVLFLAGYFCERWEFLRELAERRPILGGALRSLRIPQLEYLLPPLVALGLVLVFFFLQRDLGPALVLAFTFLLLYAVARARPVMLVAGIGAIAVAFFIGYRLGVPHTVAGRIAMWLSPWDNAARGGEHLAHSLWAFAGGETTGTGLGLGEPQLVPAVHTDMVLAAVAEELGFLGILAVAALYAVLVARGLRAARRAAGMYSFFLAVGLTLLLALQILLIAGGVLGLLPLSGVVSPFLSSGRTAMLANFLIVGLLAAISARGGRPAEVVERRFVPTLRRLQLGLALALAMLLARAAWVQVVRPARLMARGALTLQGDGQRRFQYNPRLVEIARGIPRGSILDRNGIPLATSDPQEVVRHQAAYARLGVPVAAAAPGDGDRIYPFGGRTFHLLGDLSTRVNWAAKNTSYAERDSRVRLQGFDDFAGLVEVRQPDGRTTREVQLDYSELIPVLRHRHQPEHPEVKRVLQRDRTLRMAIDVRLQLRAAEILARYARQSGYGGAAVVVDPASGELLAAVSYPWPERLPVEATDDPKAGVIDRARYGIYPPGSTFKLVTAMAALRKGTAAAGARFECKRLPDGRVGNYVRGWGRPVRDDPTDQTPHGTVDLERGLAVSCNAYFAQLATFALGPQALLETAARLGIAVARPNTVQQLKDALPQAGYGQGQVVATPLQMARVAATVANGGATPEARWTLDGGPATAAGAASIASTPRPAPAAAVLALADAARMAHAMRRVVTEGTAAGFLGGVEPAIAGKTGTAEVRDKKSHSWFVGYAPYGPGGRKIAFAVIIEHGGYGGRLAAPAAGEIVKAAAELGLIR